MLQMVIEGNGIELKGIAVGLMDVTIGVLSHLIYKIVMK